MDQISLNVFRLGAVSVHSLLLQTMLLMMHYKEES